jgi:hypothetical protein
MKLFTRVFFVFFYICAISDVVVCLQVNHMSFGKVTKQSAHDYVQAYMRYTYHDSVKNQFWGIPARIHESLQRQSHCECVPVYVFVCVWCVHIILCVCVFVVVVLEYME